MLTKNLRDLSRAIGSWRNAWYWFWFIIRILASSGVIPIRLRIHKTFLASVLAVFFASAVSAAKIEYAGYGWDDSTSYVVGGGLEWLRWSETESQSIDTALSNYEADGWVLATRSQVAGLFDAFFPGTSFLEDRDGIGPSREVATEWDSREASFQFTRNNDGPIELPTDPEKNFVSLFGNTLVSRPGAPTTEGPFDYTAALLGTDPDGDGYHNLAIVFDDFKNVNETLFDDSQVYIYQDNPAYTRSYNNAGIGVALVRPSPVPLPATASLLLLGLVVLGYTGQSRRKTN